MHELDAYLGLIIFCGITHQTRIPFDKLWENSMYVPPIFSAVMNRDRAREIKKYLRSDDIDTRVDRLVKDKLAPIRGVYDIIVKQFKSSYQPNATLTIDERISPFRGRVAFRIYMKNKPQKYGIKLWLCCDSVNYYVLNFSIYSGKIGNEREVNQGENVVMNLTSHLGAGYNITTDNFFTSIPLALKLQMRKKNEMTLLGTIKASRKHVPDVIKNHSKKEEYDSIFLFNYDHQSKKTDKTSKPIGYNMMILSYIPKKNKSVCLLSSSHPTDEIIEGDQKKPQLIDDYNKTKYGVDKLAEMTKSLSCMRATRRWTMNIFSNMLDMICLNAFICYREKIDPKMKRFYDGNIPRVKQSYCTKTFINRYTSIKSEIQYSESVSRTSRINVVIGTKIETRKR